jgi:hypothetical protein
MEVDLYLAGVTQLTGSPFSSTTLKDEQAYALYGGVGNSVRLRTRGDLSLAVKIIGAELNLFNTELPKLTLWVVRL